MSRFVLLTGALAGVAATLPMTLVMEGMHRLLPPQERYPLPPREMTDSVLAKAGLGEQLDEDDRMTLSLLSHFSYGAATGAVYAVLAHRYPPSPLAGGISFGLGVWLTSYLGWIPAAGVLSSATQHPLRRTLLMLTSHAVWGTTLGFLVDRLVEHPSRSATP